LSVGLPYALREAGLLSGIVLLLVLGVVTDWTIRLIVLNAKMSGRRSYIDIMDSCEFSNALYTFDFTPDDVITLSASQVLEEKEEQLVHFFNSHSHSV